MSACLIFYQEGKEPQRHELADKMTLGRAGKIKIAAPADKRFSRIHAVVEMVGDDWYILDGNGRAPSTNGVYVNKAWHRVESPQKLLEGDHIYFFPGINRDRYCVFVAEAGEGTLVQVTIWEKIEIFFLKQKQRLAWLWQGYRWLSLLVAFAVGLLSAEWETIFSTLTRLLNLLLGD